MFITQSSGLAIPAAPIIVGSTVPNSSGSIAVPAHIAGDLILIGDLRIGNTTADTKPTATGTVPAWVDIDAPAGAQSRYFRTCQFVVPNGTQYTSGTWSFPSGMFCIVVRGQAVSGFIGGHALQHNASSTSMTAPAMTPVRTDGSSLIICIHTGGSADPGSAPAGYTRITNGTGGAFAINTKNSSTSDGSVSQTYGTASASSAAQIEICSH